MNENPFAIDTKRVVLRLKPIEAWLIDAEHWWTDIHWLISFVLCKHNTFAAIMRNYFGLNPMIMLSHARKFRFDSHEMRLSDAQSVCFWPMIWGLVCFFFLLCSVCSVLHYYYFPFYNFSLCFVRFYGMEISISNRHYYTFEKENQRISFHFFILKSRKKSLSPRWKRNTKHWNMFKRNASVKVKRWAFKLLAENHFLLD